MLFAHEMDKISPTKCKVFLKTDFIACDGMGSGDINCTKCPRTDTVNAYEMQVVDNENDISELYRA